jgi:chromosome segregation ATPase
MSESETNEFVPVPLPFQIPEPPDLSKLPISVIHSATVETLISQTEDLSARLKVQIRRNAVMERRALELEESFKTQEKQLSTLQQQHEVLNEKDNSHIDKIKNLEEKVSEQKKEIELLEVRYSEQNQLHTKESSTTQITISKLEQQVEDLSRLLPLEKDNFRLSDENSFFKTKIEELCQHLQTKENEIQQFKDHIKKLEARDAETNKEIIDLQKQVQINDKIIDEKAELENLVILKDREKEHALGNISNELMTTRQELKNIQMAFRSIQSEKAQTDHQLKSSEETINALSKDNSDLEKQIQNLQSLWYKLQAEFEKERTKTAALTKLNRELSVELQRSKSSPQYDEDFLKKYSQGRNLDM